jgi:D-alanyl-D-alanine carboxypeptidase/D-alanyl-D-alanine-endopeptidase (penicillin-binding protein 4)
MALLLAETFCAAGVFERWMRRFVSTWGAILVMLGALAPGAAAQSAGAARALTSALNSGLANIGGSSGAYVVDMNTGQTLYRVAAGVGRLPASVEKIYTTSAALLRFGADATLQTSVLGTGAVDPDGVWHGALYLKGGGDPTFGSAAFDRSAYGTGGTVEQLVSNLVRNTGITSVQGQIVGDESYFDSLRGTPPTGFGADMVDVEGLLSGLAFNRGFANFDGTVGQSHPALYATQRFVAALRAAGVRVPAKTPLYTGQAPAAARRLAAVRSPRIAKLIQQTNTPSDNYFAEMLLKGLGARFAGAGTTAAGATVVRQELATRFGIGPQLNDGSGLSYSDYTSPRQVVSVLRQLYTDTDFFNSLAVGGVSGTLRHEMLGTPAQGNCHGKTGTLNSVANLVGYCRARDGHELAFAFLANGVGDTAYTHAVEGNQMAPALSRYNG